MHTHMAGRATIAALGLLLVCSGVAVADSVGADADIVATGTQTFVNLGTVSPGATVGVDVGFELVCLGLAHAEPGSTLTLTPTTTPAAGGSMSATTATLGPVPRDWPADGDPCIDDPTFAGSGVSSVSITAPSAPGSHVFKVAFARSPSGGVTGTTIAQFMLTVASNTSPVLDLPGDLVVEGDTTGGWTAAFTATATDSEDDPDPAVTCAPAIGDLLPLGTTIVHCSATDSGGATTSGSFSVSVVDTTPPDIDGGPDITVPAAGMTGASVVFDTPAATDLVDGSPVVTCDPPSGSTFPVGSSLVTCTAVDASGNASSGGFAVVVEALPATVLTGAWLRPLSASTPALVGHAGRTLPLKVVVSEGDAPQGPDDITAPVLRTDRLATCAADAPAVSTIADGSTFHWSGGAWHVNLDTSRLGAGCVRVSAVVDGVSVTDAVIQLTSEPVAKGKR